MRLAHLSDGQGRVVAGVIRLLIPRQSRLPDEVRERVLDDVERFVALQVENVPTYLRVPYLLAVTGFGWLPVVRFGRRFLALPLELQRSYLALWSESPLGPMRDFVRLIRNCALLAYYDHPDVRLALCADRLEPDEHTDSGGTWASE